MKKDLESIWGNIGLAPRNVILFSYLIQSLDFIMIVSIFRYLIYYPDVGLTKSDTPLQEKEFLLLLLIVIYHLGQILFSPFAGAISDWLGRRKTLLFIMTFWVINFLFGVLAISLHSISLFFLYRLIGGSIACYRPLALGIFSDLHPEALERHRSFSLFSCMDGIQAGVYCFVIARLVQPSIDPIASPYFYFFLAAFISALNCLFIYYNFQETCSRTHPFDRTLLKSLRSFSTLFKTPQMLRLYGFFFFTVLSLQTLILVHMRYILGKALETTDLCLFYFLLFGASWASASAFLLPQLIARYSSKRILSSSLLAFALLWAIICFVQTPLNYPWIMLVNGGLMGLIWPHLFLLISWNAAENLQGKAQGLAQLLFTLSLTLVFLSLRFSIYHLQLFALLCLGIAYLFFRTYKAPLEISSPLTNSP